MEREGEGEGVRALLSLRALVYGRSMSSHPSSFVWCVMCSNCLRWDEFDSEWKPCFTLLSDSCIRVFESDTVRSSPLNRRN